MQLIKTTVSALCTATERWPRPCSHVSNREECFLWCSMLEDQSGLQAPSMALPLSDQRSPTETQTHLCLQYQSVAISRNNKSSESSHPWSRRDEWICSCLGSDRPGPVKLSTQSVRQTLLGLEGWRVGGLTVAVDEKHLKDHTVPRLAYKTLGEPLLYVFYFSVALTSSTAGKPS